MLYHILISCTDVVRHWLHALKPEAQLNNILNIKFLHQSKHLTVFITNTDRLMVGEMFTLYYENH